MMFIHMTFRCQQYQLYFVLVEIHMQQTSVQMSVRNYVYVVYLFLSYVFDLHNMGADRG